MPIPYWQERDTPDPRRGTISSRERILLKLQKQLNEFLNKQFVLVIEPALNYRTSIKNFMNNLKVKNVRYVGSVAEAKREMLTIKVGLFIVEWQMPEKNGLEFCREMRQQAIYKTTPFLLLSTENLRADVVLASEGGIDSYLLKPFAFTDFCSQISQLLASIKFPSSLNSLLERAEAHLNQNDIWVAETLFKEALNIKPTSAKALCGLGCVEM